jgi:hypothetical protein
LLAITVIGLLRGLFWVATFPVVYSDEGQHFSYIESLATGKGIPVTGRAYVTQDTITLFKSDHVDAYRSAKVTSSVSDPAWGLVRQQYEGFQGPLYYLLMTPFFWLGRPFGLLGAVYSIRLATLLLALTAVPLVGLLAKEVFPERRAVWLLAPACLVALEVFNAQFSLISNDGIMVPLGALCLLAFARSWRGLVPRRGAALGASFGLAVLAKGSAPALLPALALGFLALIVHQRPSWREVFRWAAPAVIVAAVLVTPWLAFSEHAYGALSGIKANAALTTPIIGKVPFTAAGIGSVVETTKATLFTLQSLTGVSAANNYRTLWAVISLVSIVVGFIAVVLRRTWDGLVKMTWLAASMVLGYSTLVLLVFTQAGGGSNVVGRHLGVLEPMFCLLLAYAVVAFLGSGTGSAFFVMFLVAGFLFELPATNAWVRTLYARPAVIGKLVPVVDQSLDDGSRTTGAVRLGAPCPASLIALIFSTTPPPAISINGNGAPKFGTDGDWTIYRTASTTAPGVLDLSFASPVSLRSDGSTGHGVSGATVTPDARVYCAKSDPDGYRFRELYRPEHPFPLSLNLVLAWPAADLVVSLVLAAFVVLGLLRDSNAVGGSGRRSGSHFSANRRGSPTVWVAEERIDAT